MLIEVMRYFNLNHRPSLSVKLKLKYENIMYSAAKVSSQMSKWSNLTKAKITQYRIDGSV